jgi:hypothetical protein
VFTKTKVCSTAGNWPFEAVIKIDCMASTSEDQSYILMKF